MSDKVKYLHISLKSKLYIISAELVMSWTNGCLSHSVEEHKCLNSELWHACAGPLVSLPSVDSPVVYFPQGHSEQVAASTNKEVESQIPNYPNLPPQLICQLHNVTMHADAETDEVYAQMTLQPLNPQELKDLYLPAELGSANKQLTNYFCKILTESDTSNISCWFSVHCRAARKVVPPLDFTQQPPCQELMANDLHVNEWKFRHFFRGQPKRHLLTTGWSVFVSAKRLVAGDSVLFIWNDNNQLLLGIRWANRPQTVMPSFVLCMHIGLLAAAAHVASTNSRFTIFYNPRDCAWPDRHLEYSSPFWESFSSLIRGSLQWAIFFFLSGLGLIIWSEINYAVLHQAKELQGFASTAFASEHSAGRSSSRSSEHSAVTNSSKSSEQQACIKSAVFLLTGGGSFVGYVLCNKNLTDFLL